VVDAGQIVDFQERKIQIMHNGLKILEGCYYGSWMTHIIEILKGHHEPQEELVFYNVMQHLRKFPSKWGNPRMIELGSFWAYYSMWFLKEFPSGTTYGVEPDPTYLKIGEDNFALNNLNGNFIQAQVSSEISMSGEFRCESDGKLISIPSLNFSAIVAATKQNEIDLLLVDIQGAEIALLENLAETLLTSTIRFMLISTHDLEISGSPITHQTALDLLTCNGAHILLEHSVSESYSGDGLILASFSEIDKGLDIPISYNRSKNSLFGEWEPRIHMLQNEFKVSQNQLKQQVDQLTQSTIWKTTRPLRLLISKIKRK
jgi:FkbM family methyltransferase